MDRVSSHEVNRQLKSYFDCDESRYGLFHAFLFLIKVFFQLSKLNILESFAAE